VREESERSLSVGCGQSVPTEEGWKICEICECGVYGDEGEASCAPNGAADSIRKLLLVPILNGDKDVCMQGSSRIEFGTALRRSPNQPSGFLVLVELDHSPGMYITKAERPGELM
jgi:hypothetical protein